MQYNLSFAHVSKPAEPTLEKLISGGQTGADRAALDIAIRHDFPHGGWCPKGRLAEDGPIGGQYNVFETPSASYLQRTEWNVRDTDGTVVFTLAKELTGGSLRTMQFAKKHGKPCILISSRAIGYMDACVPLGEFVAEHRIRWLNVAGSRESKEPGVWQFAYQTLDDAFFWHLSHEPMIGGPGEG